MAPEVIERVRGGATHPDPTGLRMRLASITPEKTMTANGRRELVYVAAGFKKAKVKWTWMALNNGSFNTGLARFMERKRWAVPDPKMKWAGLGTTLLGYRRGDAKAEKILYRFYLDFDAEGDLERARSEAVKAADGLIGWGCRPWIRFSGSKGFGIEIGGNQFHRLGWMQDAHLVGKRLHHHVVEAFDLDPGVVDDSLWAIRKLIVRENVPHPKTSRYSIPLTAAELHEMAISDIVDLAARGPRHDVPRVRERCWSDKLNALIVQAVAEHEQAATAVVTKSYPGRSRSQADGKPLLPIEPQADLDLTDLLDGLTPCIRSVVNSTTLDIPGRRNEFSLAVARWARTMGLTLTETRTLLRKLLQGRLRVRTPLAEAMAEFEPTLRSIYDDKLDGLSPVTCHKLDREFGLDCTDQCPFHAAYKAGADAPYKRQRPVRHEEHEPETGVVYHSVAGGRARVKGAVDEVLRDGGVSLLRIPAGIGKTFTGLVTALGWSTRADRGSNDPWRILYVAERHELIEQANLWFKGVFHHIRPRENSNCERWEKAIVCGERGFSVRDAVCCGCPHFEGRTCEYWKQWKVRDRHWAMTLDMATGLALDRGFGLVVMDEALLPHLVDHVTFNAEVVAGTVDRAHPDESFPDVPGFFEVSLAARSVDTTWWKLLGVLKGLKPGPLNLQGAAAVRVVRDSLVDAGVADPVSDIAELIKNGVHYTALAYGTGGLDDLPPRAWVEPALDALLAGVRQLDADAAHAGAVPLRLVVDDHGWTMGAGLRKFYELGDTPVVLLDATGDRDLSERLLGRPVHEVHVRARLEEHQAVQIADAKYARSTLLTPSGKVNPRTWRRVKRFLASRCKAAVDEHHGPGKTLIITYKAVAEKLLSKNVLADLGGEDRVTVTWFWGNRGKDFSDHDQVIVVGYPFPNEDAVVDMAAVLYQGEDIDTTTTTAWRPYLVDDGKTGLEVRVFTDARVQRICEQLREAEFVQGIMRIRPLEKPWKRVVLLTQVPALPEHDVHLSALIDTSDLFERDAAARQIREEVKAWVSRLLDRYGWVGMPWIASLCRPKGFTPTPSNESSIRGSGGKPLDPLDAVLPRWGQAAEAMLSRGHGIEFDREDGKRDDRLREHFEAVVPAELGTCTVSLQTVPPPSKGGRPWSTTMYTRGVKGRLKLLERLRAVVETGNWTVKVEGELIDLVAIDDLFMQARINEFKLVLRQRLSPEPSPRSPAPTSAGCRP